MTKGYARCSATVYYLDISRYTGRGKSGFEREWQPRQCKRSAKEQGLCEQHLHVEIMRGRRKRGVA